jgi:hypothetical protein
MDLGAGCHLGLVLRFKAFLTIPPGAATVEVIANVRGADNGHTCTTKFSVKVKYSTNFLISKTLTLSERPSKAKSVVKARFNCVPRRALVTPFSAKSIACEIFPTRLEKTFLEENSAQRIMKV